MAILQGISGMQIGDGSSGKIALSLKTRVIRMLADQIMSYATATIREPSQVKTGSVSYYVPEIIGAEAYGSASSSFDVPQASLVNVKIDTRDWIHYEYETFDVERLGESDYILSMIASGIAMAIQARLNAAFLQNLADAFSTNAETASMRTQKIELAYVVKPEIARKPDEARNDYYALQYAHMKINQMFDKNKLGVPKSEIMAIVAPVVDIGLQQAF